MNSALDVVTIDLIKDELRIPDGVTSQDNLLQNQIEAAVSLSLTACAGR